MLTREHLFRATTSSVNAGKRPVDKTSSPLSSLSRLRITRPSARHFFAPFPSPPFPLASSLVCEMYGVGKHTSLAMCCAAPRVPAPVPGFRDALAMVHRRTDAAQSVLADADAVVAQLRDCLRAVRTNLTREELESPCTGAHAEWGRLHAEAADAPSLLPDTAAPVDGGWQIDIWDAPFAHLDEGWGPAPAERGNGDSLSFALNDPELASTARVAQGLAPSAAAAHEMNVALRAAAAAALPQPEADAMAMGTRVAEAAAPMNAAMRAMQNLTGEYETFIHLLRC